MTTATIEKAATPRKRTAKTTAELAARAKKAGNIDNLLKGAEENLRKHVRGMSEANLDKLYKKWLEWFGYEADEFNAPEKMTQKWLVDAIMRDSDPLGTEDGLFAFLVEERILPNMADENASVETAAVSGNFKDSSFLTAVISAVKKLLTKAKVNDVFDYSGAKGVKNKYGGMDLYLPFDDGHVPSSDVQQKIASAIGTDKLGLDLRKFKHGGKIWVIGDGDDVDSATTFTKTGAKIWIRNFDEDEDEDAAPAKKPSSGKTIKLFGMVIVGGKEYQNNEMVKLIGKPLKGIKYGGAQIGGDHMVVYGDKKKGFTGAASKSTPAMLSFVEELMKKGYTVEGPDTKSALVNPGKIKKMLPGIVKKLKTAGIPVLESSGGDEYADAGVDLWEDGKNTYQIDIPTSGELRYSFVLYDGVTHKSKDLNGGKSFKTLDDLIVKVKSKLPIAAKNKKLGKKAKEQLKKVNAAIAKLKAQKGVQSYIKLAKMQARLKAK